MFLQCRRCEGVGSLHIFRHHNDIPLQLTHYQAITTLPEPPFIWSLSPSYIPWKPQPQTAIPNCSSKPLFDLKSDISHVVDWYGAYRSGSRKTGYKSGTCITVKLNHLVITKVSLISCHCGMSWVDADGARAHRYRWMMVPMPWRVEEPRLRHEGISKYCAPYLLRTEVRILAVKSQKT